MASDPKAFLDVERWTFTLTFTDPNSTTPTDLTGSRLFVVLAAGDAGGLDSIQTLDSAARDGSVVIVDPVAGKVTFNAHPSARTWRAPFFGPMLLLLPTLVFGDVYRQVGDGEPVGLTRLTLRVLPSTGAPSSTPPVTPDPGTTTGVLDFSDPANSGLLAPFLLAQPADPATGVGVLDFSDPANSGFLAALFLAQPAAPSTGSGTLDFTDPNSSGLLPALMLAAA